MNVTPISMIANKPLKVDLTLACASSDNINFEVNSFIAAVISYNCFAVVGGDISRKASFIGFTTLRIALKTFLNDSRISALPPISDHD